MCQSLTPGYINRKEFQKVLVDFHFNLDKAELEKLLTHIGMKADEAQLEYEGFLKFFGANEGSDAHSYLNSTHRYGLHSGAETTLSRNLVILALGQCSPGVLQGSQLEPNKTVQSSFYCFTV